MKKILLIFIGMLCLIFTKIPILVFIGTIFTISFGFILTTQTIKKKTNKKLKEYSSTYIGDNKSISKELYNNCSYELTNNNSKVKVKVLKKTKF